MRPEMFGIAALGFVYYLIVLFFVWKFYQVLSKISDNLAGIRGAIERNSQNPPVGL